MIARSLALLLLLMGSGHAAETVFVEDFEAYGLGDPVTAEAGPNRWQITGFSPRHAPGQGLIITGEGFNSSQVAWTTPTNAEGLNSDNSFSIVANFPEQTKRLRFSTKLYSDYGSSQIVLRFAHERKSTAAVQLLFRTSPSVELVALDRREGEETSSISLGRYQFKRWYELIITVSLDENEYQVELVDLEKDSSVISVQGLDVPEGIPAINNLVLGAIFGTRSSWHWDDVKVEKLP